MKKGFRIGDRVEVLDTSKYMRWVDGFAQRPWPVLGTVVRIDDDGHPPILVQHDEKQAFLHSGGAFPGSVPEDTGWWYDFDELRHARHAELHINPDLNLDLIL